MSLVPFHELATAAYCPRKLYYARRHDRSVPPGVEAVREVAFAYDDLLAADDVHENEKRSRAAHQNSSSSEDDAVASRPVAVSPTAFRRNLRRARDRFPEAWPGLVDPPERDVLLSGLDCRGYARKVLADPPVPTLISAGKPPECGVWRPQGVRAVAAAKALSWREGRRVERAFVEYPAHGVVREVRLTTRRKAAYRRALRTVREMDGPPPRLRDDAKCDACEFRPECGVKTRSLRSLLGG